jgi:hypothetical protein
MPKQSSLDRVVACIARHPDWDEIRIANSLAISRHFVRSVMRGESPVDLPALPCPARASAGVVSLAAVREKLDTRSAIIREISALPGDQLIEDRELRQKACGHDANRFRRTVENNADFFKQYRVKLRLDEGEARWYWGRAETIAEALRLRDQ